MEAVKYDIIHTSNPKKDGLNWYAYVGNSPLRYTDTTGLRQDDDDTAAAERLERQAIEAKRKAQEEQEEKDRQTGERIKALQESLENARSHGDAAIIADEIKDLVTDYNSSNEPPEDDDFLNKKENGEVLYPNSCIYFGIVNGFIEKGYRPLEEDISNLESEVVKLAEESGYALDREKLIWDVFGLSVDEKPIEAGISEEAFTKLVGENPALLKFKQSDFWGKDTLEGNHGAGYADGTFMEAYVPRRNKEFDKVVGSRADFDFAENVGGYFFEI